MTENDSTGYSEEGSDSSTESKPNFRRKLEGERDELRAERDQLAQQLANYERRDTFRSAGLDPDDSRVKYFVKGYEGELDVEAIRQEASAAGFLGADAPPPASTAIPPEVLMAEQRIQSVGEGGDPVSQADLEARIKATSNPDELRALMESEGYLWGAAT
tara:strand:+ start:477 stop:956 length:480 start_codon:yes stop_codon:yes gene_type:complete